MLEHDIRALEQKIDQLIERNQSLQLQNQLLKEEQVSIKHAAADLEKKKHLLREQLQQVIKQLKELDHQS